MQFRLEVDPSLSTTIRRAERAIVGVWLCSGSSVAAEICAGSGVDWLLIDTEHAANSLPSVQAQLQTVRAYPVTAVVRVASNDRVLIKQHLDLGAQNIIVPMVDSEADARAAVAAVRYPPHGVRGVGAGLSRSGRWNRVADYVTTANDSVDLFVQIESADAVRAVREILAVEGIDGIFIGPADLAASMGYPGRQTHPDVVAAVESVIRQGKDSGVLVGVNAFDEHTCGRYLELGADFVSVAADVSILARATEDIAAKYRDVVANSVGMAHSSTSH